MQIIAPRLTETYEATPETVGHARAALAQYALAAGATAEQADAVRLAVSEAMTNAVIHAYGGGPGSIHVTAGAGDGQMWILIADDGGGLQPQADRPGLGLGLGLISQVSDDMAIVSRSGGGTEVQMRFTLQIGGAAPAEPDLARHSGRVPGRGFRPPASSISVLR
jgi:anti-sigma regulatory factor (Ser/Thr protein kinase)